jgi:hypothetical protein
MHSYYEIFLFVVLIFLWELILVFEGGYLFNWSGFVYNFWNKLFVSLKLR